MSIYITGDTHRQFDRIADFCKEMNTTKDDILIILGDAGINYYLDERDIDIKEELATYPITFFCIHGNHEERPFLIPSYQEKEWHNGIVYFEEKYPNLLFAKDGEIYDLNGKKAIVIGGAYSVDKWYRLQAGYHWFESEQPTEAIKKDVEHSLEKANWKVDYVFTHCTPYKYEPRWAFLSNVNQSLVDQTTEKWLDTIEERLDFENWYCGHYHVDSLEGPITIMFEEIEEL